MNSPKYKLLQFLIIISFWSYAQSNVSINFALVKDPVPVKMDIKLLSGKVIKDSVILKNKKLISTTNNKVKIHLKEVDEIIIHKDKQQRYFKIIKVKTYPNQKQYKFAFGSKFFNDSKIEAYHAYFGQNIERYTPIKTYRKRTGVFAKYKNQHYAYSIASIDGSGWKKIKKRLTHFFKECPELFDEMLRRKIYAEETLKILRLHSELCGQ
jgi:hypothetical protein